MTFTIMMMISMIFLHFFVFFLFGLLISSDLEQKPGMTAILLRGLFLYFALFEIISVPATFLRLTLTGLSVIWAVVMLLVSAVAVWLRRKQLKYLMPDFKNFHFVYLPFLLVIAVQIYHTAIAHLNTNDASFYVGTVSTTLYTNRLSMYDPYTGDLLAYFNERYVFSTFPIHNAVICRLTGIHTLIEVKTILSIVIICMINAGYYQLGKQLFTKKSSQPYLFVIFMFVIQNFFNTVFTNSYFMFRRIYEGKTLLGNLIIPCIFAIAVSVFREKTYHCWLSFFIVSLAAVCFSSSCMMILPVALVSAIFPLIFLKKKPFYLFGMLFAMLPPLLLCAAYFSVSFGFITLTI